MMEESGAQATVELAVVAPVMIVLALIVYNAMVFASAVARFDRVAPDIALAQGSSPKGDDLSGLGEAAIEEAVRERIEGAMDGFDVTVEVHIGQGEGQSGGDFSAGAREGPLLALTGATRCIRCVLRYEPHPRVPSIAGVVSGAPFELVHERVVTIDPWRSGVVV